MAGVLMSPVPNTPKTGSKFEQPHVAKPWWTTNEICQVRPSTDGFPCCPPVMAAKDSHLHKPPPQPGPLGLCLFWCFSLFFPPQAHCQLLDPSPAAVSRVVSSSTHTVQCLQSAPAPAGTSPAVPAVPRGLPMPALCGQGPQPAPALLQKAGQVSGPSST